MIADFVARVILQKAVRGKTLAGDKVLNSPMMALKEVVDSYSDFSPVICVSSSDHVSDIVGQDTQGGSVTAILSVCILIPPSARVVYGDTVYEIKGQGPFASAVGDIIVYQVLQALRDSEDPWARLWARMVPSINKFTKSPPYLEVEDSLTVPARMLTIQYKPLADPVAGRPMTDTYRMFHDLMLEDAGLRVLAPMFKSAIEDPAGRPDWAYIIMQLGLSDEAATNTGIRPYETTGDPLATTDTYETDPAVDPNLVVPNPDGETGVPIP